MLKAKRMQAGAFIITLTIGWLASPAIAETSIVFEGRIDYMVGENPFSLAIGDLDGDSHPDLAMANGWGDDISVR